MKVFLYVTEGQYQGLYGIENMIVTEDIKNYNDASEYASGIGWQLIESFDTYSDYEGEDLEEIAEINWAAWKIKDDVTLSLDKLNEKCCRLGYKLFIKEYCEKEALW